MTWYDEQPPSEHARSHDKFLICLSTNAQLGVSVDFQETDLKKAYRKAAMKVSDLVLPSTSI